jgi:glutamyl-tRNA synthetase
MFRFAPSPVGDMYISDLRIALFNFICAKQQNYKFVIRIEDIDEKRNIKDKDKDILEILSIFGIAYDNLYYQSNNFKYHLQFASTLLDEKKAFMCFCTNKELEEKEKVAKEAKKTYMYDGTCENIEREEILQNRKPFTIRIKKPKNDIKFKDTLKGDLSAKNDEIDSFVIMNVDKYPTYNFACAIDDMLQGITHVIRCEDYLFDSPKQEYIRKSLGYNEKIVYTHLPKILDDTDSVQFLLDQGFLPEAIINYLVLLSTETPNEIFTIDEVLKWFDINSLSKSSARFDIDRLKLINTQHIKLLSDEELAKRMGYSGKGIGKLAKFYAQSVSTTFEIKQKIDAVFTIKTISQEFTQNLEILKKIVQKAPDFDEFDEFKKYLIKKSGFKGKFFFEPLKTLLTNSEDKVELKQLYPFIKNYLKEIAR